MKKFFLLVLLLVVLVTFSLTLFACGETDDNVEDTEPKPNVTEQVVIIFHTNGGVIDNANGKYIVNGDKYIFSLDKGSNLSDLPTPAKFGYFFLGWGIRNDASTDYWTTTMPITDNLNLYASWEKHSCMSDIYEHNCFICGEVLTTCTDSNNDHHCDICVEIISFCKDSNEDDVCDICGKTLAKLLYRLKADDTYEVSGYEGNPTRCVIPNIYEGKTVTSIGKSAFYECTSLKSVIIPNTVSNIKMCAFGGCISLVNVTMPDSLESIGDMAFASCFSLISVIIPDSVKRIGDEAFGNCYNLTSVTIGKSVTTIESSFLECFNLVEVYNLSNLTITKGSISNGYVGSFAKDIYTSLESKSKLSTDGNGYIVYTNGNDKILIGYVGKETSLSLPNGLTEIDYAAFEYDTNIIRITIPNTVTKIGDYAFACCKDLRSVTIPDSITSIGESAFWDCDSLTSVNYLGTIESWCGITFSGSDANPLYHANKLYLNGEEVTNLVIPDTVTEIKNYVFYGCTSLTNVTIPNSVESIGEEAFAGCDSLTSVTIPNSVESIGDYAFLNCGSLTSVTIPNSVESIGDYAFRYCDSLTSITIPNSVENIGEDAFHNCTSLIYNVKDNVKYLGNEENPYIVAMGMVDENATTLTITDSCRFIHSRAFDNCSKLESVRLPDRVTSIGASAFYYCTSLSSVVIPDTVTSIGDYAFSGCTALTSVTIGNSVESIGNYAFSNWGSLIYNVKDNVKYLGNEENPYIVAMGMVDEKATTLTISDSCKFIGDSAFEDCTSLTSVTIPNAVTSIGRSAFSSCYKLVEVYNLSNLTISKGYSSNGGVGYYAKNVYTSLETPSKLSTDSNGYIIYTDGEEKILIGYVGSESELTLPSEINSIYQYAFYNNETITSVVIPDSVTSIGSVAFAGCDSLTSLTIPNSVESIGSGAFRNCTSLIYNVKDNVKYFGNEENLYLVAIEMIDETATTLVISDSCKIISDYAFHDCSSITSVTIGNSVKSIGAAAFSPFYRLTEVYYVGTTEEWSSIDIVLSNGSLINATCYYYSEMEPTEVGYYWHYVDGVVTVW